MVPSTRAYSKSGSSDRHSKTRAKTPPFTQRRKRWKTLFQWPKSLGRSRHGTPVRTRHSTASRKRRLSLAVAPGSQALPGNSGAIFSQTASPTMNRDLSTIAPPHQSMACTHPVSRGNPQCQQALIWFRVSWHSKSVKDIPELWVHRHLHSDPRWDRAYEPAMINFQNFSTGCQLRGCSLDNGRELRIIFAVHDPIRLIGEVFANNLEVATIRCTRPEAKKQHFIGSERVRLARPK